MHIELIYRTIPAWLLTEYLVKLGGQVESPYRVGGDGWSATLTELTPDTLYHVRVEVIRLEFEGAVETLKRLVPAFQRYAMRAGG